MKPLIKLLLIFLLISEVFLLGCVQETHLKEITFQVDMNGVADFENIGVRGNFTSDKWNETVYLLDEDGDGIYNTTISQKTANFSIEFKFVKNDDQFELEGQENRKMIFEYKPEIIIYETIFNDLSKVNIIKK